MERSGLPKALQLSPLIWQAGSKWLLHLVTNEMVQFSAGLENIPFSEVQFPTLRNKGNKCGSVDFGNKMIIQCLAAHGCTVNVTPSS